MFLVSLVLILSYFFRFFAKNLATMKKLIVMLAAAILAVSTLSAQVAPGLKYKDIKDMYNTRDYVKSSANPYSPGWSGVGSFFLPGLGQMICGETGRGLAILGGDLAFGIAGSLCSNKLLSYVQKDADGNYVKDAKGGYVFTDKNKASTWGGIVLGLGVAVLAYDIWNICDAVRIAKVKNMYFQDLQGRRTMEFNMYPSVDLSMTSDGARPVAGMGVSVRF